LRVSFGRFLCSGGFQDERAAVSEVNFCGLPSLVWALVPEFKGGILRFVFVGGDVKKDDNIKAGQALNGFHEKLNRLTLKATGGTSANYQVTWGSETKTFSKEALAAGINLAAEFEGHPLAAAFEKIWKSVGAKQDYETRQIKTLFHGPEGAADIEATAALTEKVHTKLAAAVKDSYAPVDSVIKIQAAP
jgi:hypothetical protein